MARKTMEAASMQVAIPEIGEVVNLADADSCALAFDRLVELGNQVTVARKMIAAELIRHSKGWGANKMRLPHAEVTVANPSELSWQLDVLRELRDAGLPEARWDELVEVTVSHKVNATVANAIEKSGNPAYADIVGRARVRHAKPPTVSVARRATA